MYWIHNVNHTDVYKEGYIGVSNNPSRRFYEHRNSNYNPILEDALKSYADDVNITILFTGSDEECYSLEKIYRPTECIGWNIAIGGNRPPSSKPGWHHTEQAKKKIAEKKIGVLNPQYGKTPSEISKQKMSLAKLGIPKSEEHKQKMSNAMKGENNPNYGKKMSEETKRKISDSIKNKKLKATQT